MNTDPNEPAYPSQNLDRVGNPCEGLNYGMTIRAEIASRIMAGLCAGQMVYDIAINLTSGGDAIVAKSSVSLADALIAELNKPVAPSSLGD